MGNKCYTNDNRTYSNIEYEVICCIKDKDGNFTCLTIKTTSMTFLAPYRPNSDDTQFFTDVKGVVEENNPNYYVICGDSMLEK